MALMEDNHSNHADFMAGLFALFDPEVLTETVIWVFRTYLSRGFQLAYWEHQLKAWMEVIRETLDAADIQEILAVYQWIYDHIEDFEQLQHD